MLDSIPLLIAVGTILGFLAGLGVGGGSLLIVWLTMVVEMDYTAARGINLLFFLPAALIAILFHRKHGNLDIKTVLPGMLAGCAAAAIFSHIGLKLDMDLLKKLFGVLLLFTGVRELLYKGKK